MIIHPYARLPSTNLLALQYARQGAPEGTVIWCRRQSQGRGQYDRTFLSPPGGLYFSLILRPTLPVTHLSLITLAAGVACSQVLHHLTGQEIRLKYPNDLYLGNRKLGGILTETGGFAGRHRPVPPVICGIGINGNTPLTRFPQDLRSRITTLLAATGRVTALKPLLAKLVGDLLTEVDLFHQCPDMVLEKWRQHDYLQGKSLVWQQGTHQVAGQGVGLDRQGRYVIVTGAGKRVAVSHGRLLPTYANCPGNEKET